MLLAGCRVDLFDKGREGSISGAFSGRRRIQENLPAIRGSDELAPTQTVEGKGSNSFRLAGEEIN
jgi:hypothetical protein